MKSMLGYISSYLAKASLPVHGVSIFLLSLVVYANYAFGINHWLYQHSLLGAFTGWYMLLAVSLLLPYLLYRWLQPGAILWNKQFWILLSAAPLVFAWKMTWPVQPFGGFTTADFWNGVAYFPVKIIGTSLGLYVLWQLTGKDERWMGLRSPIAGMRPYWLMLLLMVPLIFLAATQPDFQAVYPKLQHVVPAGVKPNWYQVLLFELAYGSDFITIELFFRGFLVVYFARWAGAQAILPMAVLYCVIHFGKPLGECISSFFGGMLLGIVSYRTQSIWGGLVVHLGIAWLMELAPGIVQHFYS